MARSNLSWMIEKYCPQCEHCGGKDNLLFRHRGYPIKSINGFEILCRSCHVQEHSNNGNNLMRPVRDRAIITNMDNVDADTKKMIKLRAGGQTFEQIGKVFGISRQGVQWRLKPFKMIKRYVVKSQLPTKVLDEGSEDRDFASSLSSPMVKGTK